MKQCVEFSLLYFGSSKKDWVIKTKETFSFLSLINNSVTARVSILLLSMSTIISLNTINIVCSLSQIISSLFSLQDLRSEVNIKKLKKIDITTGSLKKILGRKANWKSPGPDLVHGFWSKNFSSLH